jgi:hypothetical protein
MGVGGGMTHFWWSYEWTVSAWRHLWWWGGGRVHVARQLRHLTLVTLSCHPMPSIGACTASPAQVLRMSNAASAPPPPHTHQVQPDAR